MQVETKNTIKNDMKDFVTSNDFKIDTFTRIIGFSDKTQYIDAIKKCDIDLTQKHKDGICLYLRIAKFEQLVTPTEVSNYISIYENIQSSNFTQIENISQSLKEQYLNGLKKTINAFKNTNTSETMIKNFVVKLLFWVANCIKELTSNASLTKKIIYHGKISKQEYLCLYFLSQIGITILYLNTEQELTFEDELLCLSKNILYKNYEKDFLDMYNRESMIDSTKKTPVIIARNQTPAVSNSSQEVDQRIHIKITDKEGRRSNKREELSYEELAGFARSVGMIIVHDKKGNEFATGSGIMISNDRYILTNSHVIAGGSYFTIQMEDSDQVYRTERIVKYHNIFDLALLHIDKQYKCISIYKGNKNLARGQAVIAIGSPLGLFNTVSDGIISGFRTINDVNMIQFTAPISNGSSGGAILNKFGELIGISTSGINSGQNLNLAVEYSTIHEFVKGFLK